MAKFKLDEKAIHKIATEQVILNRLLEVGYDILFEANQEVPVVTGDLRDSGYSEIQGKQVRVGYRAEYAAIINADGSPEAGSKWHDPHSKNGQSFFSKAVARDRGKL